MSAMAGGTTSPASARSSPLQPAPGRPPHDVGTINVKQSPVLKRVYGQMTDEMGDGVRRLRQLGGFYDNYPPCRAADR